MENKAPLCVPAELEKSLKNVKLEVDDVLLPEVKDVNASTQNDGKKPLFGHSYFQAHRVEEEATKLVCTQLSASI